MNSFSAGDRMILWDWNGTLLDDARYSMDVMNRILNGHRMPPIPSLEKYREIFCFPVSEYYARVGITGDRFQEDGRVWMDHYLENEKDCPLRDGAEETMRSLRDAGIRQIILSASVTELLEDQTRERGVRKYLDTIIALDDIWAASKLERGKRFIRENRLDPGRLCMIGDTLHDAEVAKGMGIHCVLTAGGHQSSERLLEAGVPVCRDVPFAAKTARELIR